MAITGSTQFLEFDYAKFPLNCVRVFSPELDDATNEPIELHPVSETSGIYEVEFELDGPNKEATKETRERLILDYGPQADIRRIQVATPLFTESKVLEKPENSGIRLLGSGRGQKEKVNVGKVTWKTKFIGAAGERHKYAFRVHGTLSHTRTASFLSSSA